MNSWSSAWRELIRRRGRSLLSLLSVVIAVAAIVAVVSATATTREAYRLVFEALAGRADLEVVARGGGRYREKIADTIRTLPGVRDVVPVLHRATILYAHGEKAKVLSVGIVPGDEESVAGFQLAGGRLPSGASEVALEESLAAGLKLKLDDEIRLLTNGGLRRQKVVGLVKLESAARLHQGGMMLAPVSRLQAMFRTPGEVDALHIFLHDPGRAAQVATEIAAKLPPELRVGPPSSRSGLAEETLLLSEVSLNMASALSFTTSVFIALGVFLMNVGERRRQLAILRAIGATRRQIVGLVCREALLLGLFGTLLGIPLGVYGGKFLIRTMATMLQATLPETPDLRWAVVIGAVLGPAICLLAAWYPAWRASRVSPLEGIRPMVTMQHHRASRSTTIAGLIGAGVTLLLAVFSVRGDLPIWSAVVGLVLSLVSLVLLLPWALPWLVAIAAWPLIRHGAAEFEMAKRLVLRHGGRSALTIGVLFMAVAAGVGTSNAVFSITDDIRTWYERTITADFLLRVAMPDMSGQDATTMSEELHDRIVALGGIDTIEGVRLLRVEANGHDAVMIARDFQVYPRLPLDVVNQDPQQVAEQLASGEVVVGSVLANRLALRPGDELSVIYGDQTCAFRVAGIATEYSFGGSVIYVSRATAERDFHVEGVDSFLIKAKPIDQAALEPKLRELADEQGLLLQSFAGLLKLIDGMVAGVTGGLWVLLTLGLVVGALGVINTLTMNVLEQTRELGMLKAIGMRRGQVILTVLGQAGLMGLLGILTGAIAGTSLARMINLCLASMFGHQVPFSLRPLFVVALAVAALAVVVLAAFFPARRAANLNAVEAMRQE